MGRKAKVATVTHVAPLGDPSLLHTIPETAARLGCHRDHVYTLISTGALDVVDIAAPGARKSKTRVPDTALAAYIARQTRGADDGRGRLSVVA